jgi:hypothetical protein
MLGEKLSNDFFQPKTYVYIYKYSINLVTKSINMTIKNLLFILLFLVSFQNFAQGRV